jgi:hypothetical protein
MTVREAALQSGLSEHTLRVQLKRGRLRGRKHGRDWFIEVRDLAYYMKHISDPSMRRPSADDAAKQDQARTEDSAA